MLQATLDIKVGLVRRKMLVIYKFRVVECTSTALFA